MHLGPFETNLAPFRQPSWSGPLMIRAARKQGLAELGRDGWLSWAGMAGWAGLAGLGPPGWAGLAGLHGWAGWLAGWVVSCRLGGCFGGRCNQSESLNLIPHWCMGQGSIPHLALQLPPNISCVRVPCRTNMFFGGGV